MHGDPLLHPSALNTLRDRTLSACHLRHAEPRRGPADHRTSTSSTRTRSATRRAPCTRWDRSGRWSRAVTCGPRRTAPDLLFDGAEFYEFDAERIDTGHDHGAGDTLAAATACALAHGYSVPDAVAFAKQWVTECLRAAYPLGHGHGPVSALFRLPGALKVDLDAIAGVAHEPDGTTRTGPSCSPTARGAAGTRRCSIRLCDEWARRGWLAVRYDLPYRRRRPKGPPSGSATADQAGIVEAVALAARR